MISFGESVKKTNAAVKGKWSSLLYAFALILIPLLIINCYTMYVSYGGTGLNYSALDSVDYSKLLGGNIAEIEAEMQSFQQAIINIMPSVSVKVTVADKALELIALLLMLLLDAIVTILAVDHFRNEAHTDGEVFKASLKMLLPLAIVYFFTAWLINSGQSMIFSSVCMLSAAIYTNNVIFICSSVVTVAIMLILETLFITWILLLARYTAVAKILGRTRMIFAFAYARECLRGRIWKNMFRIMLFVFFAAIIPVVLQAVALIVAKDTALFIAVAVIMVLLQTVAISYYWVHTALEFFENEKESGIEKRIRDMMEKAIRRDADEENKSGENGKNNNEDESQE